jgi:cytochrome c oxidase cbb3-type subunit III
MWRALLLCLLLLACEREERDVKSEEGDSDGTAISLSELHPGGGAPPAASPVAAEYTEEAYAMSEGKRLFTWFNCSGCHANGGGAIGPALMDEHWIYGSAPENIFATIIEGRPNGMPSYRGRIPDQQVWQLAAYVRSLSGLAPRDAAPGRSDALAARSAENALPPPVPDSATVPPASLQSQLDLWS